MASAPRNGNPRTGTKEAKTSAHRLAKRQGEKGQDDIVAICPALSQQSSQHVRLGTGAEWHRIHSETSLTFFLFCSLHLHLRLGLLSEQTSSPPPPGEFTKGSSDKNLSIFEDTLRVAFNTSSRSFPTSRHPACTQAFSLRGRSLPLPRHNS